MKSNLDNDLENEDLNKIKALIINILSPASTILNNKNSETFFILLDFV